MTDLKCDFKLVKYFGLLPVEQCLFAGGAFSD